VDREGLIRVPLLAGRHRLGSLDDVVVGIGALAVAAQILDDAGDVFGSVGHPERKHILKPLETTWPGLG